MNFDPPWNILSAITLSLCSWMVFSQINAPLYYQGFIRYLLMGMRCVGQYLQPWFELGRMKHVLIEILKQVCFRIGTRQPKPSGLGLETLDKVHGHSPSPMVCLPFCLLPSPLLTCQSWKVSLVPTQLFIPPCPSLFWVFIPCLRVHGHSDDILSCCRGHPLIL